MKKGLIQLVLFLMMASPLYAQMDLLYISVVQPDRDEIPSEAGKQLERKMVQLLTANGITSIDVNNRFIITAKANVTSKDIVASTPQRISEKIDFTFLIGDIVENKVFETITVSLLGIGGNENKAFISAINQIKPQNKELVSFLDRAKEKIVNYYSVRCSQIIKHAQQLASGNEYDEAIYQLMQVPDICDCSKECQDLMIEYTIRWNNATAAQLLNEAKARWTALPTSEGASDVADIIAKIPANTDSQSKVETLIFNINKKLRQDEKRQWDFKMKQYNDARERERREYQLRVDQQMADNSFRVKQMEANGQLRKVEIEANRRKQAEEQVTRRKMIEAARSVGMECAKNMPRTIVVKNLQTW